MDPQPGSGTYQVQQGLVSGDLHSRLISLATHAKRAGSFLTNLTFFSSAVGLMASSYLGYLAVIFLTGGSYLTAISRPELGLWVYYNWISTIAFIGSVVLLFCGSLSALLFCHGLLGKYRTLAASELRNGGLGLVIADEGLWRQLFEQFRGGFLGSNVTKPYNGLERHLVYCVAHWFALKQIPIHMKRFSWFRLATSRQDFNQLYNFYQPKWWISLPMVISLALSLAFVALLNSAYGTSKLTCIILMGINTNLIFKGSRYIICYARLTALVEFYSE